MLAFINILHFELWHHLVVLAFFFLNQSSRCIDWITFFHVFFHGIFYMLSLFDLCYEWDNFFQRFSWKVFILEFKWWIKQMMIRAVVKGWCSCHLTAPPCSGFIVEERNSSHLILEFILNVCIYKSSCLIFLFYFISYSLIIVRVKFERVDRCQRSRWSPEAPD